MAESIMMSMGTNVETATPTLMSFEEFERIEDTPDEIELLKGELIRLPPPLRTHMESCEELYERLKPSVGRLRKERPDLKLGKVHIEMGYLFPGTRRSWLRPDVSITHPDQPGKRFYEGAPLMVFEIVSENDTARQLDRKVAEYLANGAAEVWVLYPETRHAQVYRAGASEVLLESRAIHSDLLPGIEIPLEEIL